MTTFQPADHLRSRTFLGLLVAQFLAAFNDQAIHAAAMFYAINTGVMHEAQAITWMPVLFYAPWAIFGTVAGYLADRYSKQYTLIFWKVAEVVIAGVALFGFWLGRHGSPAAGAYIVLATVFLMGMHSAFFVPAKYGAMPEILTPRMLSRGNGVLESLSFLAVILGTVVGGVLSTKFRGEEYKIGLVLAGLAVVGAAASFFIQRMPAANPTRPFPPYVYKPLVENISALLRSRPLAFAVVGIAFFTFLVAFMRATVYMHGQSQVPPWTEQRTSIIVGMVALGIGVGSPLVGYLSGGKVEVGLVPIGAVGMMLATTVAALALGHEPTLVVCIVFVGFFTGFYLVPLFTLLQHRAPKTSKGDAVATSNFINVTGAILASGVFWLMNYTAIRTGVAPALPRSGEQVRGVLTELVSEEGHPHKAVVGGREFEARQGSAPYRILRVDKGVQVDEGVEVRAYTAGDVTYYRFQPEGEAEEPVYNKSRVPQLLFLSAGGLTLLTLLVLWRLMPELFARTALWWRNVRRYRLEIGGMSHLPGTGPVVLVTDAPGCEACLQVVSATDRTTRFVLVPAAGEDCPPGLGTGTGLAVARDGQPLPWDDIARKARAALAKDEVVGLALNGGRQEAEVERLLGELTGAGGAAVLPVHYALGDGGGGRRPVYIVAGNTLPAGSSAAEARAALGRVAEEFQRLKASGKPLGEALAEAH